MSDIRKTIVVAHEALERLARISASLIGIMQTRIWFSATPDRHDLRVGDELVSTRTWLRGR
jgi:hypothetical protein